MSLKSFYEDKQTQKEWLEFMLATLDEEALARVYRGEDTAAVKEAREIIDKAFRKLYVLFTPKRKKRQTERAV